MAYLFVERPEWFQKSLRPAWFLAALVPIWMIAAPYIEGGVFFETLNSSVVAVGFAGWLRVAYGFIWNPVNFAGRMTERIIRGTALASYSIYLVHVLIMADLHTLLSGWPRGAAKSAFILSVTLVVCIMFYFAVEKPSIVTRDMFLQRKKRMAAKAPQML